MFLSNRIALADVKGTPALGLGRFSRRNNDISHLALKGARQA